MTDLYEAFLQHGKDARGELAYVEVPELGEADGTPIRIYYYRGLDGNEFSAILPHIEVETGTISPEGLFAACRHVFRNEKGEQLFASDIKWNFAMRHYDPALLLTILNRTDVLSAFFQEAAAGADEQKKF